MEANQLEDYCDRCAKVTRHRKVKDKRQGRSSDGYTQCAVCLQAASLRHRHRNWFTYLAQKANARKRPGSEKLTGAEVKAVWSRQNERCAISGRRLDSMDKWWKPSLDRIDNTKGYTKDNIRIVAWIINHCRGDLTDAEFFEMCMASVVREVPVRGFVVGYSD